MLAIMGTDGFDHLAGDRSWSLGNRAQLGTAATMSVTWTPIPGSEP